MHFITGMYSLQLYITTCHARDGVSDTPEHSNHIYLPSSSLIGDPDTVAWLRAACSMRAGMTGLFDLQFQVIPFCYVHSLALLTNAYLVGFARC